MRVPNPSGHRTGRGPFSQSSLRLPPGLPSSGDLGAVVSLPRLSLDSRNQSRRRGAVLQEVGAVAPGALSPAAQGAANGGRSVRAQFAWPITVARRAGCPASNDPGAFPRACALSVTPGNSRRSSTAADSSATIKGGSYHGGLGLGDNEHAGRMVPPTIAGKAMSNRTKIAGGRPPQFRRV
jgi:hypothetical protein